jgi:ABC-type multidrug transport system permease subunit
MFLFSNSFLPTTGAVVNIADISASPLLSKVVMDKIAERRKRTAFAIVFVVFLGVVVVTLLWALDIL